MTPTQPQGENTVTTSTVCECPDGFHLCERAREETWQCRCFTTPCHCPERFGVSPVCAECGRDVGEIPADALTSEYLIRPRDDGTVVAVCVDHPDGRHP